MEVLSRRNDLIQNEFRSVLSNEAYHLPTHTDGILVLSAAPERDSAGNLVTEASEENIARIKFSIDLMKQIAAKKAGIEIEELAMDQFYYFAPPLILDGETEQLPTMRQIALSEGLDADFIEDLDCGRRGVGNTKTNMEAFANDPRYRDFKHITIVTTDYHAPRVFRTADKNLPMDVSFDVIPMPHSEFNYNVYRAVRGEVRRIETYTARGDIGSRPIPITI